MTTPLKTRYASPINPAASFGRIDQGVDYSQTDPFRAIGSGTIYRIDPNFYKGTPAVYQRLDQPVRINGRTYSEVYYAETDALVTEHQRVVAGQPVIAAGSAEIGFANGGVPFAHSVYNEGDVTQAGQDFAALLELLAPTKPSGGGGFLHSVEKAAGTGADIVTGGVSGALGVPSFLPSPSSIVGGAADALGLNPTKWVKELTGWATKEATIGFLYLALTLGAFMLLALALRRSASAAPGPAGYIRSRAGAASIAKLAAAA